MIPCGAYPQTPSTLIARGLHIAKPWMALVAHALLFSVIFINSISAAPSDECYRAARFASHEVGVPAKVLLAITKTETGRTSQGVTHPWPWAINVRGKGKWYDSDRDLLEAALEQIALGETLFDLGCFQINYRWHGQNFASIDEMISPRGNALYAAKFLKALFEEFNNWTDAVGAYHSRTEALADIYKAKFSEHYDSLDAGQTGNTQTQAQRVLPGKNRVNTFPLLRAANLKPRLGSLVPSELQ